MEVLQSIKLTEFTTAIERQDLYLLEPENNDTNLVWIFFIISYSLFFPSMLLNYYFVIYFANSYVHKYTLNFVHRTAECLGMNGLSIQLIS